MNCDCVERVNKKLEDAGYDHRLSPSLVFDDKMQAETLLTVSTMWVNQPKHGKKKPPSMICTYCPFCRRKTRGNKR